MHSGSHWARTVLWRDQAKMLLEELPSESGGKACGYIFLSVHNGLKHIRILYDDGDLGISVAHLTSVVDVS